MYVLLHDDSHTFLRMYVIILYTLHEAFHTCHYYLDLATGVSYEHGRQAAYRRGDVEHDGSGQTLCAEDEHVGRHEAQIEDDVETRIRHRANRDILLTVRSLRQERHHDVIKQASAIHEQHTELA